MYHGEFRDPRLVALYDAQFSWGRDDDFFVSVVAETPGARVLDLGCGTGRLALALAASGHRVTGVDPAPASLDAARAKPGADRVTWLDGTSRVLPDAAFDVAVMTSHVAQFFVSDADWVDALADVRRSLVAGGRLAFDTRDPGAQAWLRWNPRDSRTHVRLTDGTVVRVWTDVTGVGQGAVDFTIHYLWPDAGELTSTATLRFRTEEEVRSALTTAGFIIEHIYGGWDRQPVGAGEGELLVIARG